MPTKSIRETAEFGPFSVHDTMREGGRSVACELLVKHPLQSHLENVIILFFFDDH
jgi:hypothetical protein